MLAELMQSYVDLKSLNELEGTIDTLIPGVRFYRACQGSPRQSFIYRPGIVVMGQGYKEIHLGSETVRYGAGNYLVLGVPLPLECEAFAENGLPILSLFIDVDSKLLHKLVSRLAEQNFQRDGFGKHPSVCGRGINAEHINDKFNESIQRLLLALHDDTEAAILGPSFLEEIVYRVLTGENSHILFDLARHEGHYARIAKVLSLMHLNYAEPVTVENLAEQANMSLSGFHRAFRQVTTETPLQYLKKLRLSKAKELIISQGLRANDAAMRVGYLSPSQFSREFKRHFNATPRSMLS
ncbi:MAG: AraC family transcriptional regulator [Pseudomonadales bacterium]|nr:AraC family transcriptional regulator [Pseudomonadales bacterium]NRA17593.1 AraC family transcriptional regulator [Oceanospirillaceae bacterium]